MQVQNMQLERERMEAELSIKQSELKLKEADLIIAMHELQNKADANDQDMQAKAAIESAYIMLQQEKNDIERSRLKLNTAEARGNLQLKEVQAAADTEIRKVDTLGKLFTGAAKNVGQQQNNQQTIRPGRSTNRPIV
jgi:tRNA U34 5-carboxymethylaminomethyl modifying GTPase MnmE/TrmE